MSKPLNWACVVPDIEYGRRPMWISNPLQHRDDSFEYITIRYLKALKQYIESHSSPRWDTEKRLTQAPEWVRATVMSIDGIIDGSPWLATDLQEAPKDLNTGLIEAVGQPPSWEDVRPKLTELYPIYTLDQIRGIMAETHGFYASEQMYKKRFALWGLRKYMTHEQKRRAISELKNGPPVTSKSTVTVDGISVKASRVRRPVVVKGTLFRLQPLSMRNETTRSGCYHANFPLKLSLDPPMYTSRPETLLHLASQYYDFYLWQRVLPHLYRYTPALGGVFEKFRNGRNSLQSEPRKSLHLLIEALDDFEILLREQPLQLLNLIIVEFSQPEWSRWHLLRIWILGRIAATACIHLQPNYLLKRAICLLCDPEILIEIGPRALDLPLRAVMRHREPTNPKAWQVKIEAITSFIEVQENIAAEKECIEIIRHGGRGCEWLRGLQRYALGQLACLRWAQGNHEEAELLCLETLWRNLEHKSKFLPGDSNNSVCQVLAQACLRRDDLPQAEFWHAMCLQGSLFLKNNSVKWRHLQTLEETLMLQAKLHELERLRDDFRELYDEWDGIKC